MARTTRPAHAAYHPALVTVKLRQHLPRLRNRKERAALLTHIARGKDRFGFRLLHFSILNDHLHFVVEAKDRTALCRGLQGLLIRLARGLNKPEVKELFMNAGVEVVASTADEFSTVIKSEMSRLGKVIKEAGIRE
jgi:REP element-mobilizing transposase RayT